MNLTHKRSPRHSIHAGVSATPFILLSSLIFLIAMRYELDGGCHSVYTLTCYFVRCVKHRREIFDSEDIITRLEEITIEVSKKCDVETLNQDTGYDHVHVLVKTTPKMRSSSYIHSLKGVSARR